MLDRGGQEKLEAIRPESGAKEEIICHAKLRHQAVEEAVKADARNFENSLNLRGALPSHGEAEEVLVYSMVDRSAAPLRLSTEDFPTCGRVRRYIQHAELAKHPDLWARYRDTDRQKYTPSGLFWEWLPTDSNIQGKCLDFFDCITQRNYIVALTFMKIEKEEWPEPLELAPLGSPCCISQCGNLQAHLRAIWPAHYATQALKIRDGKDVLSETFDESLFDPRTNNLVVKLIPCHEP